MFNIVWQEGMRLLQIDCLRPGLLGPTRDAFAMRYCNRRLVPVGRRGATRLKYDNSGLSHAVELHMLLKEVGSLAAHLLAVNSSGICHFRSFDSEGQHCVH